MYYVSSRWSKCVTIELFFYLFIAFDKRARYRRWTTYITYVTFGNFQPYYKLMEKNILILPSVLTSSYVSAFIQFECCHLIFSLWINRITQYIQLIGFLFSYSNYNHHVIYNTHYTIISQLHPIAKSQYFTITN